MSGDHNMYCSGNQPDIVERLCEHGVKHPQQIWDWRKEAAEEIKSLRQQLAKRPRIDEQMLKGATDTAAMIVNELRQQLTECQRERDAIWESYKDCRTAHDVLTAERDELMAAAKKFCDDWKFCRGSEWPVRALNELEAALAKLGAGLRKERDDLQEKCNVFQDKVIAMREELAACQKDAKRYRWIRKCMPFSTLKNITKEYMKNVPNDAVDEQLDAAIDEAMKCN